jgi:hypothetical protein
MAEVIDVPNAVAHAVCMPFEKLAEPKPVEIELLVGAIDDHFPEHTSPSGMVNLMPPVLPKIPSTRATNTGNGTCFDSGPSIGNSDAVVLQAPINQAIDAIPTRTRVVIRLPSKKFL